MTSSGIFLEDKLSQMTTFGIFCGNKLLRTAFYGEKNSDDFIKLCDHYTVDSL